VAVKIKLKRLGKIRAPYYRIVVADARTKRDGRAIEEIGKYHPKAEPSFIEVKSDRAQHWLSVGAQPTDPVRKILEITGDWQKFKGLPGAEGTLRTAPPKEDRKEIFAAAVKETLGDTTAAPKGRGKSSAAGRDSDAAADKGSRATAKDASQSKGDKPARAKDAKDKDAKDGKDAKDKAKSGDAKADAGAAPAEASQTEASQTEASEASQTDASETDASEASQTEAAAADADSASRD
jgi:small subunit ribosomal protein S16